MNSTHHEAGSPHPSAACSGTGHLLANFPDLANLATLAIDNLCRLQATKSKETSAWLVMRDVLLKVGCASYRVLLAESSSNSINIHDVKSKMIDMTLDINFENYSK